MMKAAMVDPMGLENLKVVELPEPEPKPGEVLVRMKAATLNFRDILAVNGGYGKMQKQERLIPLSDGAGEIVAVGKGVRGLKPGDRVIGCFFPLWQDGTLRVEHVMADLGGGMDGVACEFRCFRQDAVVKLPDGLSDMEGAALPCAAATAWNAVVTKGRVGPGDRVLIQGTGGVSLFALQFAVMAGAEVYATSSSGEKMELLKSLGAAHVVNYRDDPDWGRTINGLTGRRGITHAVEIGGAATLKQTMMSMGLGGFIGMVGVVTGPRAELNLPIVAMQETRIEGVTAGSRAALQKLVDALAVHGVRPVLDKAAFTLETLRDGLEYLKAGKHVGKVGVRIA
ncbi:MAG: NAD(P)-dependent alcohol dehydrogenase [Pseudooceanicola sp.]|nr:NAD(P)-dependent alcohol dehydrogenase [Pseudooceanicola sp.]